MFRRDSNKSQGGGGGLNKNWPKAQVYDGMYVISFQGWAFDGGLILKKNRSYEKI